MKSAAISHRPGRLTWQRWFLWTGILLMIGIAALFLAATVFPSVGAHGADTLRVLIGDPAVAQLETWISQVEDNFNQLKHNLGFEKPAAPWQVPDSPLAIETGTPAPTPAPTRTNTPFPTLTPTLQDTSVPSATTTPTLTPSPTFTPTPTLWQPAVAHALGSLAGEGAWQAFIKDARGRAVAYRTFIQPDARRPYNLVAVVAFDLDRTRLNFILGYDEPSIKGGPKGNGLIPSADAVPNILLATFNGGFKAEHGQYGAMSAGVVAIPPRKGLATVAIYADGSVKIGAFGQEITTLDNTVAWRQNCSMVIQDGQINPLVNNDSAQYWGANLNGETVIWRSGLGISPDGKTLYYFAGPGLRMRALAAAMLAVNVSAGLQLDINNYWVYFAAIRDRNGTPVPEPLFPKDMISDVGRYLTRYSRDFFYITLKNPPPHN